MMMSSHDNPPRRGTRSWSTPDPVMSRGRRYSHHSRRKKNEKDGGFNKKSQSFSPRKKRDERETRETRDERKRKERRIGTIQLHSLITRERIILSCHRAYKIVKKKKELLTWLGQFTTRKDAAPVIFFLVGGGGGGASMMRV